MSLWNSEIKISKSLYSTSGIGEQIGEPISEYHSDEQITQNFINPMKILNLCANLSSNTSSIRVQILLNKFLQQITNAPYVFIIPIFANSEEGLIQVIGDRVLDKEMRFSITADNIRNASTHGFQFLISDINRDFREVIERIVGTDNNTLYFDIKELNKNTKSTLPEMVPLFPLSAKSSATGLTNCSFVLNDDLALIGNVNYLQITLFVCIAGDESCRIYYRYCIYETLRFIIGHLLTAIELDEERRIRNLCQKLLRISRNLLGRIGGELTENRENPGILGQNYTMQLDLLKSKCIEHKYVFEPKDFLKLIQGVLEDAKKLTGAEHCCLFLRDRDSGALVSQVYDINRHPKNEIRIQQSIGISGYVAESGKLLNVRSTYMHPLFSRIVDEQIGFKTRNMLCFPIYDRTRTIGVAQLCNKSNGFHFDKCDEEVAAAFSTYTSIAIMHALVYKSVQKAEARHKLSQELLTYHMQIPEKDVKELIATLENLNIKKIENLNLFTFSTRDLDRSQTLMASVQMFAELDFIKKFNIRREKLARFLLTVEKGYRELPFHNWMHAFTVAHFAYTLLMNCKLVEKGILNDIEALSFLVSAFTHDIDHRGVSNFYHNEAKTNLALLHAYEGSINERHHLSLTFYVLNDDNVKILDGLSPEQFKIFFNTTTEFILSTDLVHHLHILRQLTNLRKDNCIESYHNKHMTMSILITCCDLSDQIKEWPNPQKVSNLIYSEFFTQGDLERQMGIQPKEMMDRQKAIIPRLQISFISDVVLSAYEILANILPETRSLLDIVKDNLEHWQAIVAEAN